MPSDLITPVDYRILNNTKPLTGPKPLSQTTLTRSQLIDTVAWVLEGMIEERCGNYTDIKEIPNQTIFHAQKLPSISIKAYLNRFATHSECHENAFVFALIFLDKVGEIFDNFSLDSFNVHR